MVGTIKIIISPLRVADEKSAFMHHYADHRRDGEEIKNNPHLGFISHLSSYLTLKMWPKKKKTDSKKKKLTKWIKFLEQGTHPEHY